MCHGLGMIVQDAVSNNDGRPCTGGFMILTTTPVRQVFIYPFYSEENDSKTMGSSSRLFNLDLLDPKEVSIQSELLKL